MPKAGKPYSCALAISFFNPHHTVGNRKFGMQAQGDVGRLGHGKIGVNNKRRIVAGLAVKGRLKTKCIAASFSEALFMPEQPDA